MQMDCLDSNLRSAADNCWHRDGARIHLLEDGRYRDCCCGGDRIEIYGTDCVRSQRDGSKGWHGIGGAVERDECCGT